MEIDVDEQADAGDDEEHALGEGIEDHADVDVKPGEGDPFEGGWGWDLAEGDGDGDEEAERGGADGGENGHLGLAMEMEQDGYRRRQRAR